jgi:hypothetical protein
MGKLHQQLKRLLAGRACFMGVGNVEYGDDGFGVRLAETLTDAGLPDVIIAGTAPEPGSVNSRPSIMWCFWMPSNLAASLVM